MKTNPTETIHRVIERLHEETIKAARLASELPTRVKWDLYDALKFTAGMSLEEITSEYQSTLYDAMWSYIATTSAPITSFRNEFRRAVNDAFNLTAVAGWADGGQPDGISDDLQDWVNSEIDKEIEFANGLFDDLRERKQNPDITESEHDAYISDRVNGYAGALIGIYNYAKMTAEKDRPGKWIYGDTVDHCATCEELNDSIHPLSWYLENDYIPRQRGSETLECGGWRCDCSIVDPESGEQLIP